MAGVVLETLSNRKLFILAACLLITLLTFFLIGGLLAPKPSNVQSILGTKCLDKGRHRHKTQWYIPHGGKEACESIGSFDDAIVEKESIGANQIVFSYKIPQQRGGEELRMIRWFQNIVAIILPDITYSKDNAQGENPILEMEARLGYRNAEDNVTAWTELASSVEQRNLDCSIGKNPKDGDPYVCAPMTMFELGSCHHDFYLVNVRLPVHDGMKANNATGSIQEITLVFIHQNGGFTQIWFTLKTCVFPILLMALVWFWHRVQQLSRTPNLLERTLFGLGISLSILNLPIEWLTLWLNIPFMTLITDVRQGQFYAMLLSFWMIFAGEHMMDQVERNRLVLYWKHLGAVVFACICLFVFEMCERGVQLYNPFYSIWVTDVGNKLALAFIILAGISACLYFLFLCYMIIVVFRNISAKKSALPSMPSARKKYYQGLIYRFKFLMLATLLCAALTVIFFIISQANENHWQWEEDGASLQYTSAFFTGVYGMWNVYVFALLSLYAPSHKTKPTIELDDDNTDETVQLTQLPSTSGVQSEASVLTAFVQKAAAD